ncbi:hypothetical protein BaRGS_00001884 [Batillaria attramentaria]|uniref:Uncharacterized protein n=1 Tax=Batillaria attramentaria TaxID=370345 RepID=A0ABD0M773_9CAEN
MCSHPSYRTRLLFTAFLVQDLVRVFMLSVLLIQACQFTETKVACSGQEVQRISVITALPSLLKENNAECMRRVVPKVRAEKKVAPEKFTPTINLSTFPLPPRHSILEKCEQVRRMPVGSQERVQVSGALLTGQSGTQRATGNGKPTVVLTTSSAPCGEKQEKLVRIIRTLWRCLASSP